MSILAHLIYSWVIMILLFWSIISVLKTQLMLISSVDPTLQPLDLLHKSIFWMTFQFFWPNVELGLGEKKTPNFWTEPPFFWILGVLYIELIFYFSGKRLNHVN